MVIRSFCLGTEEILLRLVASGRPRLRWIAQITRRHLGCKHGNEVSIFITGVHQGEWRKTPPTTDSHRRGADNTPPDLQKTVMHPCARCVSEEHIFFTSAGPVRSSAVLVSTGESARLGPRPIRPLPARRGPKSRQGNRLGRCSTLDAADAIAYSVHDLDDAHALDRAGGGRRSPRLCRTSASMTARAQSQISGRSENDVSARIAGGVFCDAAPRMGLARRLVHHSLGRVEFDGWVKTVGFEREANSESSMSDHGLDHR